MRRPVEHTWLLRVLGAVLLMATFGYLPYHLYARSGFARYLELREDLAGLMGHNARLRAEIARLEREAEDLKSDPRAIEREARQRLNFVHPGEVIFNLEEAR
jgi:cell division protein FtsB